MSCSKIKKLLSYEIDSKLTEEELKILNEHIEVCSQCAQERKELADYRNIMKQHFSVEVPELSYDFDSNFYQRLTEQGSLWHKLNERFLIPKKLFGELMAVTVMVVLILSIIVGKPAKINHNENFSLKTNSDVFVKSAVIKSEDTQLKTFADRQAKELLQNFL